MSSTRYAALVLTLAISPACSAPAERPAEPSTAPVAATAPQPTTKPSVAPSSTDPVWHYEGAEGPERWGSLSAKFAACGEGRAQSPIDIVEAATVSASPSAAAPLPAGGAEDCPSRARR